MRSETSWTGLMKNPKLQPALLTLLFFGVYTTEKLRITIGPTRFRYSLIVLIVVFLISCLHRPAKVFRQAVKSPALLAWIPFLILSGLSVMLGEQPKKTGPIWAYNAITLAVCWHFSRILPWQKVARPLLWALVAHTTLLFWDEFAIAGWFPQTWALGNLYPTANTFRASGLYVAPQFYGTAIGLTAWMWLSAQREFKFFSRDALFVGFVFAGLWLNYSRTAWLMISFTGLLSIAWLSLHTLKSEPIREPWAKSVLWVLGFTFGFFWLSNIAPEQHADLQRKFSPRQTWARFCPSLQEEFSFQWSCPPLDPSIETDRSSTTNSEGRRFSEWRIAFKSLNEDPWLGKGYTPVSIGVDDDHLIHASNPSSLATQAVRLDYRFESVLALVLSDYGILGFASLLGAILWLIFRTRNVYAAAAWLAFWLVGSHSSQVFARLDIWLPTFLFLETAIRSGREQTSSPESSGSPT